MEEFSNIRLKNIEAYKIFNFLWKKDDIDWVKKRKQDWITQFGKPTSLSEKYKADFYVYGKEPPTAIISDSDYIAIDFSFTDRLWMTPFETQEQVQDFWELNVFNKMISAAEYESYTSYNFYTHLLDVPNTHFEMIVDVFLRKEYLFDESLIVKKRKHIINVADFMSSYFLLYRAFVNFKGKVRFFWQFDKVDFFVLAISSFEKSETNDEKIKDFRNNLMQFIKRMLTSNDIQDKKFPEAYENFIKEIKNIKNHPDACQLLKDCYDEALK